MKGTIRSAIIRAVPALAAASAIFLWCGQAQAGPAPSYRVLHTFCARGFTCPEGANPASDQLVRDAGGDLFGTAESGGQSGDGTIYELVPKHGGARYFKKVLRTFCVTSKCSTGGHPFSGVIKDTAGNLYGTTPSGLSACGTVYEAVLSGGKYTMKLLHAFASAGGDGCNPTGGALGYHGKDSGQLYDGTSPLFGITNAGGANGRGAVFELVPPKPGRKPWTEAVIYSYCQITGCADGHDPVGNVVMDSSDDLYVTAAEAAAGLIFELAPDGSGGFIKEPVYASATQEVFGILRITSDGTLYGVANSGGPTGSGTLFKLVPDVGGAFDYTDLHDFCAASDCTDGANPFSITIDQGGDIFGVAGGGPNAAPDGSPSGAGVLFRYSTGGNYSVLHNFCAEANCADGGEPSSGLTTDGNGDVFGVTFYGGVDFSTGAGVVYELLF